MHTHSSINTPQKRLAVSQFSMEQHWPLLNAADFLNTPHDYWYDAPNHSISYQACEYLDSRTKKAFKNKVMNVASNSDVR